MDRGYQFMRNMAQLYVSHRYVPMSPNALTAVALPSCHADVAAPAVLVVELFSK